MCERFARIASNLLFAIFSPPKRNSQKKGSVREPRWNDSRESGDSCESANRLVRIGPSKPQKLMMKFWISGSEKRPYIGHGEVRVYRGVSRGVQRTTWGRSLKNWELQISCFWRVLGVERTFWDSSLLVSLTLSDTPVLFTPPTSPPPINTEVSEEVSRALRALWNGEKVSKMSPVASGPGTPKASKKSRSGTVRKDSFDTFWRLSPKTSQTVPETFNSAQTRCIVKGEAQKSQLFWRFSGGFWSSEERLFCKNSTRQPSNLIRSPIFTNTSCKSSFLYNAPSVHTVQTFWRLLGVPGPDALGDIFETFFGFSKGQGASVRAGWSPKRGFLVANFLSLFQKKKA